MVDLEGQAGTLATIYEDRVESLATEAHVDSGRLLGRAIAHEIGHLLLGTASHARAGADASVLADRRTAARLAARLGVVRVPEGSRMRWRLLVRGRPSTGR